MALDNREFILKLGDTRSLTYLLLLGQYCLRIPRDPGAWYKHPLAMPSPRTHSLYRTFFGLAMKMSIELGLHRKRRTLEISLQSELNKRLFWSCYSWDRELSIVMGRPPSISDHDIDAEVGNQTILITRTTLLTPCSSHLMLMKPFKTWKFSEKPPAKIEHDPHNHKQQCHVSFTFCDLRFLSLKSSTKYTG